ncbi:MAG: hypothetical protein WKF51_13120 [Geodermatophilaceae bacterium]
MLRLSYRELSHQQSRRDHLTYAEVLRCQPRLVGKHDQLRPVAPSLVIVPDVRSYGRRADDKLGGDLISLERPVATQALLPSFS